MSSDDPTLKQPKRVRIIRVSKELLAAALHLPEGTEIVGVSDQPYFVSGEIAIKVENPEFTPVFECHDIPTIRPVLGQKTVVTFMGWQN